MVQAEQVLSRHVSATVDTLPVDSLATCDIRHKTGKRSVLGPWPHPLAPLDVARAALCLGRKITPARGSGTGHIEWARSAARIERYVKLCSILVLAGNSSGTIRLQPLQIDSE
jgi:hypothetical protein